ncbi:MAG: hypothetical protein HC845_10670, partial [Akkermansiaceae bacterium]|nr:hypothetical protein [Akkermansiaceae bacterium]
AWSQQAYLKASNAGVNDFFGSSVAIFGDTLVVGAEREASGTAGVNSTPNESADKAGAAYVFVRSSNTWSQQAYLKASNPGESDNFGTSVAVSGTTIAVGAVFEASSATGVNSTSDESANNAGAAYIFACPEPQFLVKAKFKSKRGKVRGVGSFNQGSKVTLKAKPKKDRKFLGWFENKKLITKKKKLVIKNLTANRSFVAKFK